MSIGLSQAASLITIVAGLTALVAFTVSVLGFLIRKKQRVTHLSWKLVSELAAFNLNLGPGLRTIGGDSYSGEFTLARLNEASKDQELMQNLKEHAAGLYDAIFRIMELYDEYEFWGRVVKLGRKPVEPG